MHFYGFGNRPLLAAYAFDVVYRQLSAARRYFLKTCRARNPRNREYLANRYCEGWLEGARSTVQAFALSDSEQSLMQDYSENTLKIKYVKAKEIGVCRRTHEAGDDAAWHGMKDGKDVRLHQAMHKNEQQMIGA